MTSTNHRSTPSPDNQEILIPRFWRTPKDGYPCQASIRFDDLRKQLVSKAQKEIRVLQSTSTWNFIIRSKDSVSVSSPRYVILTAGIFPVQV